MAAYEPFKVDLSNCEKEPIHIPGKIQSHGFLVICNLSNLTISQVSANVAAHLGVESSFLLGTQLSDLLDESTVDVLTKSSKAGDFNAFNPFQISFDVSEHKRAYNLNAHISGSTLALEFEPFVDHSTPAEFNNLLSVSLSKLQSATTSKLLFQTTADQLKILTGYDRVMVYRFDTDWHGEVIAEAKESELEPYLGLHYPASDIPAQARDLFTKNWIRMIADVNAQPVDLIPVLRPNSNEPLDMTYSLLRASSPIHIEYLQNMGVAASLTVSIISEGQLWGLIACHHRSPKFVDYNLRNVCKLIGQICSGYLSFISTDEDVHYAGHISAVEDKLFTQMMKNWNIVEGLVDYSTTLLDINECSGAAIFFDQELILQGTTPTEADVLNLIAWLRKEVKQDVFVTDHLASVYRPARDMVDKAAGILVISISEPLGEYVIWFKPEVVQTIEWGGNPEKPVLMADDGLRLWPRKSFEKWTEIVKNRSLPWKEVEIAEAGRLRKHIIDIVLRNADNIRQLNEHLRAAFNELESFSYSVSHDLRAPLRNIDSYTAILQEDYTDQLDESGQEILQTILDSTERMNHLIQDLLTYSRIGRVNKIYNRFDLTPVIDEAVDSLMKNERERHIDFEIHSLPDAYGDRPLIKQLIFNLLSNAVKYTRPVKAAKVEIGGYRREQEVVFYVKDNGIGFEEKYVDRIFGVFNRLHSDDVFEGTGIGLAIAKRVVHTHSGRIWAESQPDQGATFYFVLPVQPDLASR